MSHWSNNGAKRRWTDEQMLDALRRVQAVSGACLRDRYDKHRLPTEPSARCIIDRFHKFNLAKAAAGVPITAQSKRAHPKSKKQETDLKPAKRSKYPCWRCEKPFLGLGKRKGEWHCDDCKYTINAQASAMGW